MLALLQEAGESQTVVAAGEQWLSTHKRDARARDVAITTALAHCSVASQHADRRGDAISASAMYEVATELLRRHKAAPELQREIGEALRELQPQASLTHLSPWAGQPASPPVRPTHPPETTANPNTICP